jgi:hypothetical protein
MANERAINAAVLLLTPYASRLTGNGGSNESRTDIDFS